MTLSQKILGSGIKLVLYGEGIVRVQVGQACTVCIPHPGQVLSYLGGVWGGRHLRSRLLGNRQWKPRAEFLGNKEFLSPLQPFLFCLSLNELLAPGGIADRTKTAQSC